MRDDMLHVQMLGGFSMAYQGKPVLFERNYVSKTAQLLQIIFLHIEEGIAKETLLDALYGRDDVENRNGSLNNTIFRLRKQLHNAGLPEGKYLVLSGGIYRWEEKIPVVVDCHQFEGKIKEGQAQQDPELRAGILMEACSLYTGEFLPLMIGEDWATVSNIYYQELYAAALQNVCGWLKEQKNYGKIYELCTAASKIYPFEEWEIYRIDSLIAMNRYREAMEIYKEATTTFFDELGLPPSKEMLDRFRIMSDHIQQSVSAIEEIKNGLQEKGSKSGAYYCSFPSFMDIYHIISRMMERNGISVFIMLCTLTDGKGMIQKGNEKTKEASECLRQVIRNSLRKGDFYTRYNENQFLIMLSGTKKENCNEISNRIDQAFKQSVTGRFKISYYVTSVADVEGADEAQELKFAGAPVEWL